MPAFPVIDAIVAVVVTLAAALGWASIGTIRLTRLAGLLLGAVIGLGLARALTPSAASATCRVLTALFALVIAALVCRALVGRVGTWVAFGLQRIGLRAVDRLLGAGLSAVGALAASWLVLLLLANFAPPRISTPAASSGIATVLNRAFPRASAELKSPLHVTRFRALATIDASRRQVHGCTEQITRVELTIFPTPAHQQ